ncbi:uncharacterized protein EV154DRAFT_181786 [Mucor mucedo]|uniref:uncharacterized protein n=1 Tax=Mucor mucedo TaxID=29922 RepID=UPI00222061F3|nr:uncharacterized protein EV154DRAFT_181786 [Mucor mucedo]KAI7892703.1 hypothetical protein EV154DRAFT_181786 [Mucor mucedo]
MKTTVANWESQLSVIEKNTFLDLFKKVDADNKGIVLHDEAMDFLKKSDIPQNILTQFWNASDNENKGFLTEQEFCTILKLIACAQHGVMTGDPILATKVPLPEFNGTGAVNNNRPMPPPPHQQRQQQQQQQSMDVISPEDRQKYIGLFNSFGPENNILSGDRARAAFVQSNLPPQTLQTIWNLADTRKSGSLNQTEFIIAMFYIERAMKGLNQFPPTLPANIYASATGRPSASPLVRNTTLHVNSPPPIPKRSPVFQNRPLPVVTISPDEYQKYQTFFKQLDTDQSGYVSGADAVVFFRHSKLPESDLAKIWDLADTDSSGMLSEQEFAIAMHMINGRVKGGDLPNTLPTFNIQPPQQHPFSTGPSQQQQQQQQYAPQQQHNVDLLGLSDFSGPAPPPPQQQQQQQYGQNKVDLARSQSTMLQSSVSTETNRAQTAHQQFNQESQAVQELLKQIETQKETLNKMKTQAEEAEKLLAAEKKRKEELVQELQMYRQETKHFSTRAENAKEETIKVKTEIEELKKEKEKDNVFSLSNAPSPAVGGGLFAKVNGQSPSLFAKVNESPSLFAKVNDSPVSSHSTGQKAFDPFAGFNKSSTSAPSPTINTLKAETEQKATPNSSHMDISDIESKYPDLNTMEQNFAPAAAASASPAPASAQVEEKKSPKKTTQTSPQPSKSVSKYGFDLSAFESTNNTNNTDTASMKDELSSLFSSPSTSKAPLPSNTNGFDDIFGQSATKKTTNFEDIFK